MKIFYISTKYQQILQSFKSNHTINIFVHQILSIQSLHRTFSFYRFHNHHQPNIPVSQKHWHSIKKKKSCKATSKRATNQKYQKSPSNFITPTTTLLLFPFPTYTKRTSLYPKTRLPDLRSIAKTKSPPIGYPVNVEPSPGRRAPNVQRPLRSVELPMKEEGRGRPIGPHREPPSVPTSR